MQVITLSVDDLQRLFERQGDRIIEALAGKNEPEKKDQWFNLLEFCAYHPDKPKPPTVYGWLSGKNKKDDLPVHKDGKKLRFLKSEVDAWLLKGKRKNQFEINRVVDNAISSHK